RLEETGSRCGGDWFDSGPAMGLRPAGRMTPVAIAGFCGSSAGECRSEVPAARSTVWRESKRPSLIGPTRRHVHQTRKAKPSWESPVHRRLDDVRSKESEGKTHARRSFADAFAGADHLDADDLAGNHFVEPSPPLGDSA